MHNDGEIHVVLHMHLQYMDVQIYVLRIEQKPELSGGSNTPNRSFRLSNFINGTSADRRSRMLHVCLTIVHYWGGLHTLIRPNGTFAERGGGKRNGNACRGRRPGGKRAGRKHEIYVPSYIFLTRRSFREKCRLNCRFSADDVGGAIFS
jgi:hypothetical protein